MLVNKSYNPFKMWGGYIGSLLLTSSWEIVKMFDGTGMRTPLFCLSYPFSKLSNFLVIQLLKFRFISFSQLSIDIISYTTFILSGFLIGWGIHSLLRRLT